MPPSNLVVSGFDGENNELLCVTSLRNSQVSVYERHLKTPEGLTRLCMHSGQKAQQIARVFNACCVSPITTFASSDDRLMEKLSPK